MDFLNYVLNHWSEISAVILFIISTIAGVRKLKLSANDSAKEIGSRLMFGIEKRANEYLTSKTGAEKFKLVVEAGYSLFSAKTRLFIGKPAFEIIVQQLHDEAIAFLEKEIKKQTSVVAPNLSVSPNGNVVAKNVTVAETTDAQKAIDTITEGLKRLGVNVSTDVSPTPLITTNGIVADAIVLTESQIKQPTSLE